MRLVLMISAGLLLGCEQVSIVGGLLAPASEPEPEPTPVATSEPLAAPFDVAAVEETSEDTPPPASASGKTASTIASLGDPARQGAWMQTPLVTAEQSGQVLYQGKGVDVTLLPVTGPATAGSQLSLEVMQALGLPLADLTEVFVVF